MKDSPIDVLKIQVDGKWLEVMPISKFAQYLKVSRARAYQLVDEGMPVVTPGQGYQAWVPIKQALAWIRKHVNTWSSTERVYAN